MHSSSSPAGFTAGLIGAGIQFSSSPAIHRKEAAALGLTCSYELLDLERLPDNAATLPALLADAERRGLSGLNITFPCKQAVVPFMDELSPEAAALQSVNTVLFRGGRRIGHNTDWWGFAENFRRGLPGVSLQRVVLVGAGGAGVAVGYAALSLGAAELGIFDAAPDRAEALAQRLSLLYPDRKVVARHTIAAAMADASGLIHATPTGMHKFPGMPVPPALLRPDMWVAEIVYVPLVTELLSAARRLGCRTLDGSGMAVFQGAMAFELFSGVKPDTERMLRNFSSRIAAA